MAPEEAMDGELALRVMAGPDPQAEAELCRRFWPRLRAFGLRRLRSEQDAADLAQQVLVIVLEALRAGEVKEPERIASFVLGTCRNTLLDRHKVERRRGELLDRYAAVLPASYEPAAPVDRQRLAGCLEHLSERDRAIVVETYVEEREGGAIAADLSLTAGAVRVARHRALRQLLECLGGPA